MKKVLFSAVFALLATFTFAQAGPGPQPTNIKDHPRVNQVNGRIDNQEKRITEERKEGDITKKQAHKDRKNLKKINKEKHQMRKADGGHLTKKDQKDLNKDLNKNSQKIGN
jgi:hypothetical protein